MKCSFPFHVVLHRQADAVPFRLMFVWNQENVFIFLSGKKRPSVVQSDVKRFFQQESACMS